MARLDGRARGGPSFGSGDAVATGRLFLWSAARGEWVSCRPDEITWLDRRLLSGDEDLTLHRSPRCAGLRYVHHRWELFSRDSSYPVYLAPHPAPTNTAPTQTGSAALDARGVQQAAQHILPVAPALHYETLPVVLEAGTWLVSVGNWVLPLRLELGAQGGPEPAQPGQDGAAGHGEKAGPGQRRPDPPGQPAAAGRGPAGPHLPAAQRGGPDGHGVPLPGIHSGPAGPAAGAEDG